MLRTRRAATVLVGLLAGLLLCAQASAVPNPFKKYQPDVVVSDPYIEMHTGPGAATRSTTWPVRATR